MMAYEAVPQAGQAGQGQEGGSGEPPPPGPATARAMALAAKLAPALPGNRFLGWLGPLLITAFPSAEPPAILQRFVRLRRKVLSSKYHF